MKRFNSKISIVLLLVLFVLLLVENTSAQKRSYENKKSNRYYSDTYPKSSSLKSSATRNDYADYHNNSVRKIDSKTKHDIK